jgi:hydroxyethylthiazole kinase-like uncharacterized protein yjeF
MTELLTAAQMRALEQAAIESGEVTGLELMERAGRGVIEAVFEEWPDLAATQLRAVVLSGPGNNGGDGFVVARLLAEWGWDVDVFLYGDPEKLPPDARTNHDRWRVMGKVRELGFPVLSQSDAESITQAIFGEPGTALVFDAFFGTGLTRPISGLHPALEIFDDHAEVGDLHRMRMVAIDLPSGLCADSGRVIGATSDETVLRHAFQADLTVSFHALKLGHVLGQGPALCGKTVVKSIGLNARIKQLPKPGSTTHRLETLSEKVSSDDIATLIAAPATGRIGKHASSHKYSHGHVLVMSGGPGKTGAARLAARGALRIGAGLVTIGVSPAAQQDVASQITSIMLQRIEKEHGLSAVLEDNRITALCVGPGFGVSDECATQIATVLKDGRAVLLDADALTLIARDAALFAGLHDKCVLTPHAGEFKRLFPDFAAKLAAPVETGPGYSKVDATREAAIRAGCVVVFKGPDTVIAAPNGCSAVNAAVHAFSAPWLATAGSGDVLAGFITGLMARGCSPVEAAKIATWLHVECARQFGEGLIAEDLPEMLPQVFKTLAP